MSVFSTFLGWVVMLRTLVKLQRHGARFPTTSASKAIVVALDKIQAVPEYKDSRLDFIKTYEYNLGSEDLVQFGADQCVVFSHTPVVHMIDIHCRSFDSGQVAYVRYAKLFSQGNLPFVRSDISGRVVNSATNWTAGKYKSLSL